MKPVAIATALRWRGFYTAGYSFAYCQADGTIWRLPSGHCGVFPLGYVPRGHELGDPPTDWREWAEDKEIAEPTIIYRWESL